MSVFAALLATVAAAPTPDPGPTPWFRWSGLTPQYANGTDTVTQLADAAGGSILMVNGSGTLLPADPARNNARALRIGTGRFETNQSFPVTGNADRSFYLVLQVPAATVNVFGHGAMANKQLFDGLRQPATLGIHYFGNNPATDGTGGILPDAACVVSIRYASTLNHPVVYVNMTRTELLSGAVWGPLNTALSPLYLGGGASFDFNSGITKDILAFEAYNTFLSDSEDAALRQALMTAYAL